MNLLIDKHLTLYPNCPICGGSDRNLSPFPVGETGFYVKEILRFLDIEKSQLLDEMTLYCCQQCETLWYDPWFKQSLVSSVYTYVAGRHKFGWSSLRAWVSGSERNYQQVWPNILDVIEEISGPTATYAEVNCPFSGVLIPMHEKRSGDQARSLVGKRIEALSGSYGDRVFKRDYANSMALRDTVALTSSQPPGKQLGARLLIDEPSPMCWNRSCTYAGANCAAVAKDLLVDDITTFKDMSDRIDVVGFFNTFDHFPEPVDVLKKALSVARHVIIDLHEYRWTDCQHHFNIGTGFTIYLQSLGVEASDITDRIRAGGTLGDPRRYIICSSVGSAD
jgi:hypothetical protein